MGEEVAAGPEALVNGVAARTGAQAVASFLAAAFMAARAFCIGAASGIETAAEPDVPPRAPAPDPVEPVDPVDVPVEPVEPVEPVDPDDDDEVRPDDPDAPDPVDPELAEDPEDPEDPVELVVVVWSVVSCAWAWSNVAWASVTAAWRGVWSIVASCWPGVTVSPTLTRTPVTVPLTGNAAVTCETRFTVPVMVSVWDTEPFDAVATR